MSAELKSTPSLLTGARQTMLAWARVIETAEDIPELYKSAFQALWGDRQSFPYTVFTPAHQGTFHKVAEKLLCDFGDIFYVLERDARQVSTTGYKLEAIQDVEVGSVLLYSWVTLRGMTTGGNFTASTFAFSTATLRHLEPFINKIRSAPVHFDEAQLRNEQNRFETLSTLNFKFMNYGRSSLMAGEKVIQLLLQPEIRIPILTLFGRPIYRTVSTTHLLVLTDKEMILIWEDERVRRIKGERYGGVWRYIPLRNIVSTAMTERADNLLALSLNLASEERLEKLFAASSGAEIEQFQAELGQFIG